MKRIIRILRPGGGALNWPDLQFACISLAKTDPALWQFLDELANKRLNALTDLLVDAQSTGTVALTMRPKECAAILLALVDGMELWRFVPGYSEEAVGQHIGTLLGTNYDAQR